MPTKIKKPILKKSVSKPTVKKVVKPAQKSAPKKVSKPVVKPASKAIKTVTRPVVKAQTSTQKKGSKNIMMLLILLIIFVLLAGGFAITRFCGANKRIIEETNISKAVLQTNRELIKDRPDFTVYTMYAPSGVTENVKLIQDALISTRIQPSAYIAYEKVLELQKMTNNMTIEEKREAFKRHLYYLSEKEVLIAKPNGELDDEETEMFVITCVAEEFEFCKEAVKTLDEDQKFILIKAY